MTLELVKIETFSAILTFTQNGEKTWELFSYADRSSLSDIEVIYHEYTLPEGRSEFHCTIDPHFLEEEITPSVELKPRSCWCSKINNASVTYHFELQLQIETNIVYRKTVKIPALSQVS